MTYCFLAIVFTAFFALVPSLYGLENRQIFVGEKGKFSCWTTAGYHLEWRFNNKKLDTECVNKRSHRATANEVCVKGRTEGAGVILYLRFKNIRLESDGIYTCNKYNHRNKEGPKEVKKVNITVVSPTTPATATTGRQIRSSFPAPSSPKTTTYRTPTTTLSVQSTNQRTKEKLSGTTTYRTPIATKSIQSTNQHKKEDLSRGDNGSLRVAVATALSVVLSVAVTGGIFVYLWRRRVGQSATTTGDGFCGTVYQAQANGIVSSDVSSTVAVKMATSDNINKGAKTRHANLYEEA